MLDTYNLMKNEVANCLLYVEKRAAGSIGMTSRGASKFILVGTSFINLDEQIPSKGRLIILEVSTSQSKI